MALEKIPAAGLEAGSVNATAIAVNSIPSSRLTTTGVVANSYGNSSQIPVVTIDSAGRITNASTTAVAGVTGFTYSGANNTFAITTGDGSTFVANISANSIAALALGSSGVVANAYGNSTAIPVITIDEDGRISNATTTSVSGVTGVSYTAANSTLTVSTSISNYTAPLTAGNSSVQGLLKVVDSVANGSTDVAASANSVKTSYELAGNAVSNATSYAATAYSNAVSTAASDATTKAGTAYSNAVSQATTLAGTAYSNAVSVAASDATTKAGTAYSNAVSQATTLAGTAYSNAVSYAGTIAGTAYSNAVSVAASDATTKAGTAYSNAVTVATSLAGNAYSNAVAYADAKVANLVNSAPAALDTLLELAAALGNDASFSTTVTTGIGNAYTNAVSQATTLAGTAYSNAISYAATIAGTAYSNAVSTAASDATTKAGTAYSNATSYAATIAGTAYSNATSYAATIAGTAYSNAVSVAASDATTKAGTAYSNAVSTAASDATTKAGTAYSNAVSTAASDATTKAGTAYSNATSYAATIAGTAYSNATSYAGTIAGTAYSNAVSVAASDATTKAGTAYSNAIAYASSNSYVNSTFLKLSGGTMTGSVANASFTGTVTSAGYIHANGSSGSTGGYFGTIKVGYGAAYGTIERTDADLYLQYNNAYNVYTGYGGGFLYAYNSTRSPIFYDSDNTSYYVDPASGSNLAGTLVNNGGTAMTGGWNRNLMLSSTFPVLVWNSANTSYSGIGVDYSTAASRFYFWINGTSSDLIGTGTIAMSMHSGNYVTATGSFRAPIFYDSDDTTYYTNPAGSSYIKSLSTGGNLASTTYPLYAESGQRYIIGLKNTAAASPSNYWWLAHDDDLIFHRNGSGDKFNFTGAGNGTASSSWRAPIFYDSDNTGYYVDPASTSNLNALTVNAELVASRHYVNRGAGVNSGINWYSSSYTSWTDYMSPPGATGCGPTGNITAPSGALATSWSLRTFIESAANYGWTWESGTSSGQPSVVAEIRSSDGMAQFNGGVRAPIFYDSNDTGYYVNPNSTSRLSSIDFGVSGYYITAGDWGMRNTTPYGWIQFGPANASWAHIYASHSIYFNQNTYVSGNWMLYEDTWQNGKNFTSTGIIYANSSMRAPIFYDSDNTTYYIDPASTGDTALRMRGGALFGPNTSWGAYLAVGGNGWYGGGSYASVAATNGNLHIDAATGCDIYLNYYAGSLVRSYSSFYAPIFYDLDNSGYYVNPASTSSINGLTVNQTITGSVSGNAGTAGGLSVHDTQGTQNESNKIVRTQVNGYTMLGWINTTSGDSGAGTKIERVYCSNDAYIRYLSPTSFKMQMGLSAKNNYQRYADYTSDSNYWVGSMGQSSYGANETFHGGSGFFDIWSGTNYPSGTSHIHGFNVLHYTVNSLGTTGGNAYGWQMASQYNQGGRFFTRGCSGGSFSSWYEGVRYGYNVAGNLYGDIYYDSDNTGYYLDPNAATSLNVAGAIQAGGNITAYYSDDRLKTRLGVIQNAVDKVKSLTGFYYEANKAAQALGYKVKREVGLSAQEIQAVLPEIVAPAPIDNRYLTIHYERVVPLLVEAIKEQQSTIERLEALVNSLINKTGE